MSYAGAERSKTGMHATAVQVYPPASSSNDLDPFAIRAELPGVVPHHRGVPSLKAAAEAWREIVEGQVEAERANAALLARWPMSYNRDRAKFSEGSKGRKGSKGHANES